IAVDEAGDAYVTGYTNGGGFPTTTGAAQTSYGGGQDAFITKLTATGDNTVYSTYLGGASAETGYGIPVDPTGYAYITGSTASTAFPTTTGVVQTSLATGATQNAFITKVKTDGSGWSYSTYLGGGSSDTGEGIAVDLSGNAYVTGMTTSTNFPTRTA